jgi:hypothetical protein
VCTLLRTSYAFLPRVTHGWRLSDAIGLCIPLPRARFRRNLWAFLWTTPTHAANERTLQLTPTSTRVRVVRQKQRPPHLAIFREVSALPFTRLAQPM